MNIKIEETLAKLDKLIREDSTSKAIEIMQLSQAVLSLAHAVAVLDGVKKS